MGLIIFRSETRVVPPGNKLKRSSRVDTGKYPEKHSAHWNYIRVLQISISYQPPVLNESRTFWAEISPLIILLLHKNTFRKISQIFYIKLYYTIYNFELKYGLRIIISFFYKSPQDCLIKLFLIGNPNHPLNNIRILVGTPYLKSWFRHKVWFRQTLAWEINFPKQR